MPSIAWPFQHTSASGNHQAAPCASRGAPSTQETHSPWQPLTSPRSRARRSARKSSSSAAWVWCRPTSTAARRLHDPGARGRVAPRAARVRAYGPGAHPCSTAAGAGDDDSPRIRRESTTGNLVHVDFQRVSMTERMTVAVPVVLIGRAPITDPDASSCRAARPSTSSACPATFRSTSRWTFRYDRLGLDDPRARYRRAGQRYRADRPRRGAGRRQYGLAEEASRPWKRPASSPSKPRKPPRRRASSEAGFPPCSAGI